MKYHPILFSAPMVRAILAGTKTQTRRVCMPAQFYSLSQVVEVTDPREHGQVYNGSHFGDEEGDVQFANPYGGRGDLLWVREAWSGERCFKDVPPSRRVSVFTPDGPMLRDSIWYWADGEPEGGDWEPLRPSIHMPRWASRITLEVTGVRVERLQDISEKDAIAEGIEPTMPNPGHWNWRDYLVDGGQTHAVLSYKTLWESINGTGSWDANPLVWVIAFRKLEGGAA